MSSVFIHIQLLSSLRFNASQSIAIYRDTFQREKKIEEARKHDMIISRVIS